VGTSHLLLTKRRVNNQQCVKKRMQPLFSTSYRTINIRFEGTTRFMTLLELCPNAAASSHLRCRNTCQSYFTEVKVPIPVASTINTNTRSQWNVGDRSQTCCRVGAGVGWGRERERETGAVNDVTQQYANPNNLTPASIRLQVDSNFASTACPSTNFTY
jgi:hypothetical protein